MKKYVKYTVGITVSVLLVCALLMAVIDPLFQYHYPWFGMAPIISTDEQYYSPGIAKSFTYNNVIIGTSMSQNFRPSWFKDDFEGQTVKLAMGGATPLDYDRLLKLVLKKSDTIDTVFMDLGNYFLTTKPDTSSWENMPTYLYDASIWNACNYLFNKDLLIVQGGYQIANNISGEITDIDEAFCWDSFSSFGYSEVSKEFNSELNGLIMVSDDLLFYYHSNLDWIISIVSENPNVKFVLFIPPYSAAYWKLESLRGSIEFWHSMYLDLAKNLMKYDNVEFYYFYDDVNVEIGNYELYKDTQHYDTSISKYMYKCFVNKTNRLTFEDYDRRIDESFKRIKMLADEYK